MAPKFDQYSCAGAILGRPVFVMDFDIDI